MKIQILLLIALALPISLGGCLATTQEEPWMFYQANEVGNGSPAPFFLTMEEAQEYCNRMNKSTENNYQVSFITR